MTDNTESEDIIAKLNSETAKIEWSKLQTFFAMGKTIYVSHKLDLIQVAHALSKDDKPTFESWMEQEQIANVSDEQAEAWIESDILVWAVVVEPWVLVQPIVD